MRKSLLNHGRIYQEIMDIITLTALVLTSFTSFFATVDTVYSQDFQAKNPPCEAIYAECR
ncbi:MAG: hypothetical protein Fur0046_06620 [Cyanobacteria bacterium J069]